MNLKDFFVQLVETELSQHAVSSFDLEQYESEPDPRQYSQILSAMNAGLRNIYTYFWLATDECVLDLQENLEIYTLNSRHAQSNTDPRFANYVKYISDTPENPFKDNIYHIEELYDEAGNKLSLNRLDTEKRETEFFSPSWNQIQVPYPNSYTSIAVMYRSGPERLRYSDELDIEIEEVPCPPPLIEALTYFTASKIMAPLSLEISMGYSQKYAQEIALIEQKGLFIQPEWNRRHFDKNGWV